MNEGDFIFNPVYKVDVMDNVSVNIGAYILDGNRGNTYGTYADKDYCYVELQKSFLVIYFGKKVYEYKC